MKKFIWAIIALFFLSCQKNLRPGFSIQSDSIVVQMQDNGKVFTNPGMGWNLMYYTFDGVSCVPENEKNDLLNWVPCDIISFRLSWNTIEPIEGQYNWKIIDDVAAPWIAAGKRVAFKFYTNFLWDNAHLQATPLWVKDAGAKGRYIDGDGNPSNDTWVADYSDPVLLQKLGNFYTAVANHYKDQPVEFMELGSIGRVGEGNSYQMGGIEPSEDDLKKHIDLFKEHFPKIQLIINDDYEKFACNYAKTLGYGVDDHSIGVGGTAGDPNNPGRAYNKWIIGGSGVTEPLFQDATVPIGLENETWHQIDNWYLEQMIAAKANYCRIHQNPSKLKDPSVQTILKNMNLNMGYRIQFPSIKVKKVNDKGTAIQVNYTIKNGAAGYCLKPFKPTITIKDLNDNIISTATDENFDPRLLKSASDKIELSGAILVSLPAGFNDRKCKIYISMVNAAKTPAVNLPYNNDDGNKRYLVTEFAIK